ncbi:DinB family protein [Flagellimonas meishanensis]|uniref:DinB family protein n=1 Tax=Flagellimonas meishanensis TaxID=2873264 RepID=UPI001CA760C1|nr:DinB family protein [[Muricauda] meishanensis]
MKRSDLPTSEYNPFYHNYILAIQEDTTLNEELVLGKDRFLKLIQDITDEKLRYAYAPGKWTIAELCVHIMDAERVFQYRALRFARMDKTPLPGFDHDNYVPASEANSRKKQELLEEYKAVRESTIQLFKSFTDDMLKRVGVASGSQMSVRALGFIISGHQAHHLKIISERYL